MKKVALLVMSVMVLVVFQAWGAEKKSVEQIDIAKLTCMEAMRGNDTDRTATAAIFLGFLMAKRNTTMIDVDASSAHSMRAMDYCLSNPKSTVMEAFTKTDK